MTKPACLIDNDRLLKLWQACGILELRRFWHHRDALPEAEAAAGSNRHRSGHQGTIKHAGQPIGPVGQPNGVLSLSQERLSGMVPVRWRRILFWLLLLDCLLGCAPALAAMPVAEGIPNPAVTPLEHWEYRWGDSPKNSQGAFTWLAEQSGWMSQNPPLNPPGRQGNTWIWLRVRLPQLQSHDSLYLRGIDEHFEVYLRGKLIYHFGHLPPKSRYYPGFPWHMIPLTTADSGEHLQIRIYSSSRHIGIFGTPRIGSPAAHLQMMMVQDLDRLVVGCLLIFTGLLVFLLFVRQPVSGYRLLCLFAVGIGLYLICRTEIKQIYTLSPATWKWLEYLALFTAVPALCQFLNRMFGLRGSRIWRGLILLQTGISFGGLLLAALGLISVQDTTQPFLLLTLANMLLGLSVVFVGFKGRGHNGWLIMVGLLALCLFTGTDILVSLKWIPWMRPLSHWGMLLLLMTLVFLVKEQVERAYHDKRVAEESSRTKSEFLTNISHEIRTPLNAIMGFTDLLAKEFRNHPQASEYLQIIHTSGQTLLMLINDILDLSKIEAQRMQLQLDPVLIRHLADDIFKLFRLGMQEKGLKWELEIDQALPRSLMLDGVRLRQVLLNLVGNALKFTESGGIKLRLICQELDEPGQIGLEIQVEDTGIGMPELELKRIFEPFYQVESTSRRRFGGTGLGLAITRKFVELMGGTLKVSSQLNQGTCFRLVLPRVAIAAEPEDPHALVEWLEEAAEAQTDKDLEVPAGMRQLLLNQLQELQQNKSISRIQKYADQLVETAAELESQPLQQFGQQLKQALQSFDIGQINALLDQLRQSLK
jgi:signal transduction histidine kinase